MFLREWFSQVNKVKYCQTNKAARSNRARCCQDNRIPPQRSHNRYTQPTIPSHHFVFVNVQLPPLSSTPNIARCTKRHSAAHDKPHLHDTPETGTHNRQIKGQTLRSGPHDKLGQVNNSAETSLEGGRVKEKGEGEASKRKTTITPCIWSILQLPPCSLQKTKPRSVKTDVFLFVS